MWDSLDSEEESRIIIFATDNSLQALSESREWFADGTFRTTPLLFTQSWNIHAKTTDKSFALLFCLLEDKSEISYTRVYEKLLEIKPDLKPRTIMTDFEKGAMNAGRCVFTQSNIKACFLYCLQSSSVK